jgi:antitoxin component YwqK of YwqJK toxin-antitoxin module
MKTIFTISALFLFYSCSNNKTERIASYYSNGNIEWLIKYNSKKDTTNQTVIGFYPDGKIKCSSEKLNGVENGVQSTYFPGGILEKKWNIKNGYLTGEYFEYLPSGELLSKGQYVKGLRTGIWEFYNSKGEKFIRNYDKGILQGKSEEHRKNGSIVYGQYLDGNEIGSWITKSKDGTVVMETNYINGELTGIVKEFYKTGELYIEGYYKDGKNTGEWKIYNIDGEVDTIEIYRNDTLIELIKK